MLKLVLPWSFTALTTIELPALSLWFINLSGGKGSEPSEALRCTERPAWKKTVDAYNERVEAA